MLPETTHMERMIMGAMDKVAPDVHKRCWKKNGGEDIGPSPPDKMLLLQELMDAKGPEAILSLPENIPEDALYSSLLYIFLNSASPIELMEKFNRYDRYFHPTRRVELRASGPNFVDVENVADIDDKPRAVEELFLCGVLSYILSRNGCQGMEVEWLSVCTESLLHVLTAMDVLPPPLEQHTRWRFTWREHNRRGQIAGLDQFLSSYAEPFRHSSKVRVTEMVEKFLENDLGRKPGMAVAADMLGMSVRSFQRKMREEGTTYTRLFNELRIKVASRMLRHSTASVTEVGFVCGFRDSSHFSREFKKVQQMSPKSYRESYHCRRRKENS